MCNLVLRQCICCSVEESNLKLLGCNKNGVEDFLEMGFRKSCHESSSSIEVGCQFSALLSFFFCHVRWVIAAEVTMSFAGAAGEGEEVGMLFLLFFGGTIPETCWL
jgi:hypothetical protein